MFCKHCGKEIKDGTKFCTSCGAGALPLSRSHSSAAETAAEATIKCGSCDYVGPPESARNLFFTILAWICVIFAWPITVLYFAFTHKYRCPKCKSTFLGVKNKDGVFVGQRGGARSPAMTILWIFLGVAIIGILASIVLVSLGNARQKAADASGLTQEWVKVTSSDGRLSVDLPRNPTFQKSIPPKELEGFSYLAYEQQEKVAYVVKYENYHSVMVSEGVDLEGAGSSKVNAFLKALVDSQIEDYKISNFSSEFTKSHSHSAIRYSGTIEHDGKTGDMKGIIILDGESAYYVVSISDVGYLADFDRVLNSLIIKPAGLLTPGV